MALDNAPALAQTLIDAAVAGYLAGLDGDTETEPYVVVEVRVPFSLATDILHHPTAIAHGDAILPEAFCRICGCTYSNACDGGCWWVEPDLCSSCVPRVPLEIPVKREVPA